MVAAIQYPSFQPAMREITAITNSSPAIVTTSFAHNYLTGLIVRLFIPQTGGMLQVDEHVYTVTKIDATRFSIEIDTTSFDPFIIVPGALQVAQVVPIGEVNSQLYQATRNVLPNNILP